MNYRNSPQFGFKFDELIVDNFAGGGGASTGIELGIGRSIDIAINHDEQAISMHTVNHPQTKHYCESVWEVDPRKVCNGNSVGLAWFSPDCRHFSKAKGNTPVSPRVRGLAWVVMKWIGTVRPRVIMLENVEEFKTWGPVIKTKNGYMPDRSRSGNTFRSFINAIKRHGYQVEVKELRACDYGAATIRKRLFLIARCDDKPIVWPAPTHGKGLKPYKTAAEIIDWSIPCKSIFERKRPLADNTLQRIAKGIQKFVIDTNNPFIVRIGQTGWGGDGMQYNSKEPLTTITTKAEHCLVTSHLLKLRNNQFGQSLNEPMPTLTAGGLHVGEVRAFLMKYYGNGDNCQSLHTPLHAIPTKDRFGLITVRGEQYQIADIRMRMLEPHELFAAQGFPSNYVIDRDSAGNRISKKEQVAKCGNSVCPPVVEALVKANMADNELINVKVA